MKWSFRIGRISGIDVYVHFTFLLLLAWFVLANLSREGGPEVALRETAFVLLVFGIVVLHELGHALAARRYGIRTRDITLLPIGGVARLERMPDDPRQELVVALAGPAVNVVLAAGLYIGMLWAGQFIDPSKPLPLGGLVVKLFVVNVFLAVFNMIPAFPMDGGRVLRALLALRMDYVRATQVAANIGQGLALLFGFIGLIGIPGTPIEPNPLLAFIALFVWIGAAQEAGMVQVRAALGGIPVEHAMIRDFRTLTPTDTLGVATGHILNGFQQDFPVLDDGRLAGVLTRADLLAALAERGATAPVGEIMKRDIATAEPAEMLEHALARLDQCSCPALPVVRNGDVVGILTPENIGEFVMIRSALRGVRDVRPEAPPDKAV
jgi:Zn-dependent protease